jgi:uncharacterized protein (DUF2235 family)
MSKRIVYCADGTWQNAVSNTNVYRLYKALTVTSDQVTYYDDGIGADASGLNRILEGAFGQSIIDKIKQGYTKIAHVYEPGDLLYFFGFSRGAYTVRSLAGMIASCGIPTGSFTDDLVDQVFSAYRDPANRTSMLAALAQYKLGDASIQMIGVWDTVGALGIPAIFGQIDQKQFGFLDTALHPDVKNAYHALAIDEQRAQFPATLWDPTHVAGQTIEQVWFSGCHGDVGGGTLLAGGVDAGTRLCDITLSWMAAKAQANGLTFDPAALQQFQTLPALYALDAIRQSWQPIDGKPFSRPIGANDSIANSVAVRVQYALTYKPGNLTFDDEHENTLASGYNIVKAVSDVTI